MGNESLNCQRLRNQDDGRHQTESKQKESDTQQGGVPLPKIWLCDQRVRHSHTCYDGADNQELATEEQCIEKAGTPPVKALALIDSCVKHRQYRTPEQKTGKAWSRA